MQLYRSEINVQKRLPFGRENNNMKSRTEPMALADRIRQIILEMDGNDYGKQARLAEIAGCGRPVVNHWLSGQQGKINVKHALAIAAKLGYRVEWIVEGKGPRKKGETETSIDVNESGQEKLFLYHVTQKEMEMISNYRSADPMDQTMIEHLCKRSARDLAGRKKDN